MSTELAVMAPADVPDELAEIAARARYDHYRLPFMAAWDELPAEYRAGSIDAQRPILAAVLPLYGAGIIANAGVEHYNRQVELARSLTTRVYGASLLLHIAAEATQKANAGIDTALNLKLAETLRERAHQEGAP